ncbi:MAG: Uma2 family endonuclease [Rhodocyclaceae bacterium]|nr:Uma2 family endonuclease [Rhodocyclaceae bacterium]MDP1956942.1 Uma2 family endonuclease [Rhodocyclaceae bacterium]
MGNMSELMAQVRHRVTVGNYYKMAEAGIFSADDRVELIDGEIVDKAPTGSHHAGVVKMLVRRFSETIGKHAILSIKDPLHLDTHSEPEPDLMLLQPRDDFYAAAHPVASDVLLLIEVGDSTARFDREVKLPLYARQGVPEVWLVTLDTRQIEVCRAPLKDADNYTERTIHSADNIAPRLLPDCLVEVATLFPW